MRILELTIEGFRSLKSILWKPTALNVVIGPNGTGKSNLLRAMELLSVSAQGRLSTYIQRSGGMEPLVWDGSAQGINVRLKAEPNAPDAVGERQTLTYAFHMSRIGGSSAFRIKSELLAMYTYPADKPERSEPLRLLQREGSIAKVLDKGGTDLVAPEESVPEEETLLSLVTSPLAANRHIPPFREQLAAWSVYHDFHVNMDAPIRQPVVARSEKRVAPDGQNLIPVLHTLYTGDRDFKKDVDSAMRAAFGDDYDELVFPPAADQRIQLRVRWKSLRREQSAADLSDGTLRFLFLLAVLASPSPAPLIAIDEPETGLHPSMLPIVAEYAVDASRRVQVILTTHSPQFLDAFGDTKPATTVAGWAGGETSLSLLDGANLARWLKEYSLGELFQSGELENMQ